MAAGGGGDAELRCDAITRPALLSREGAKGAGNEPARALNENNKLRSETPMAGREARRENGSVCHMHSESAASVVARLEKSDQAPLFVAPQNRNNSNASRAKGSQKAWPHDKA